MGSLTDHTRIVVFHHYLEAEVAFEVTSWGCGPTGPSWNYAGDPGEPIEIEIRCVWLGEIQVLPQDLTAAECEYLERMIYDDPPEYEEDPGYDF